jgi:zinc protease
VSNPSTPVFVEPSEALPIVSVGVTFRSGAAHDPEGKDGLARITARMFRRGAEGYGADRIEETVDLLGGEFAADASVSSSGVHFEVIRRSLEPMVDLVSTLLTRPTFDEAELGRLQREAEAELIEARDSDRSLASRAFRRTLFAGHPYGRRTSGRIETLRAITQADVRACYEQHYTRANAIVIVSGDVTEAEGRALSAQLLAGLPEGQPVADPVPPPVRKPGRHLVFVDKVDRSQTQMVIGGLGTDAHDADHIPLIVANTVFGGTFTSRLMQEIRAKRGWSYGASARVGFDRQRDAFTMWTAPKATDAAACLGLELTLLETFIKEGVTAEELSFVQRYLARSHAFDIDTARKRVHQKLEAALYELPPEYHSGYVAAVQAVTPESANAAITARLSATDLVIGVVGTHAEIGDAIAKAIPDLASVTVAPFDLE